jgi:AbiV family abortive infection protein
MTVGVPRAHPGTHHSAERGHSQTSPRRHSTLTDGADGNAVALLEEARILADKGRHARAFALACIALEEAGKSQYAADVYAGFIPPGGFEQNIRTNQLKTGYANRVVQFGDLIQPFLRDEHTAEAIFKRRNDAL